MENGMSDDRKAADVSLYYQTNKNMEERNSPPITDESYALYLEGKLSAEEDMEVVKSICNIDDLWLLCQMKYLK
jgi:hypothetical protein